MILIVLFVTIFCLLLWKTASAFSVKCRTVPKIYVDSYLRMQMNIASQGAGGPSEQFTNQHRPKRKLSSPYSLSLNNFIIHHTIDRSLSE